MRATVPNCDSAHQQLEPLSPKGIQVGTLPDWVCVQGKVVYKVVRGAYDQLPKEWASFPQQALSTARTAPRGPPGDVYVCGPMDHPKDPSKMLTILYVPIQ